MNSAKVSLALFLVAIVTTANACSPPEGGFRPPEVQDMVHFANHVVMGEVTSIIQQDPMFGDMYNTYGAMVTVQCSYKGGPLSGRIRIGGAGFIPGHCSSKDLEAGKKYILFLHSPREKDGDLYMQSEIALSQDNITDILNVCDLKVNYPQENGIELKRRVCPPPTQLPTCVRYVDQPFVGNTLPTANIPLRTTTAGNQPAGSGRNVGETKGDEGNGVASISASIALTLIYSLSWSLH